MSLENDRAAFHAELIRRLADDLLDAVGVVHAEDPNFRWQLVEGDTRDAIGDAVAVIRVRTQRSSSSEGIVKINLSMGTSRIVQLIRERLRPTSASD